MEEDIKSVNVRSIKLKRCLLMSSEMESMYQTFLRERIHSEVYVMNTNLRTEIYYYGTEDYSDLIRDSIYYYTDKKLQKNGLIYSCNFNREQVFQSFMENIEVFTKHPSMFLAYSKKFMYMQNKYKESKLIMPILDDFFEYTLRILSMNHKIPYFDKIRSAKNKSQKSNSNKNVMDYLISEILNKNHNN